MKHYHRRNVTPDTRQVSRGNLAVVERLWRCDCGTDEGEWRS